MVSKVVENYHQSSYGSSRVLVAKINQDSFQVQKGFPTGTKAFNWMFEIFDGHGPHGEIVAQKAAQLMPGLLDPPMRDIGATYSAKIQEAIVAKHQEKVQQLITERNAKIKTVMEKTFLDTEKLLSDGPEASELVELSGCTGSVLMVLEDYFVVANVGDSPIIILRQTPDGKF